MSYQSPPPPSPYGNQPPYGGAPQGTNKKAIWSLVTGIAGFCCCGILAIVAIVLSRSAKAEIAQTGQGGDGLATAGFVLGCVGIVVMIINIILVASGNFYFNIDT